MTFEFLLARELQDNLTRQTYDENFVFRQRFFIKSYIFIMKFCYNVGENEDKSQRLCK